MAQNRVVSSILVTAATVVSGVTMMESLSVAQPTTICPVPTNQTTQMYQGGSTSSYPSGYSAKMFYGIPGYASGLRVKKSGYEDVSATQRNFLVRSNVSGGDLQWHTNCKTINQVYEEQKYWGDDQDARSLMAYACSLPSTTKPTAPAIRPTR